jgi:hypothetical protein
MMYLVRRRRHLGIAIDPKQLGKIRPLKADVHIMEAENQALGRTTISAWIFSSAPVKDHDFTPLLDVKIVGMAQNGMILSGLEQVGDAFYAQSWLCQLE